MSRGEKALKYNRQYNIKRRVEREELIKEHLGGILKCNDCDFTKDYIKYFDFHHIKPEEKFREVPKLLTHRVETLLKEVDKCVLLCPTCHRIRHIDG